MLEIIDLTHLAPQRSPTHRAHIEGITMHMFGVVGVRDARGVIEFYAAHPEWTGGKMPYTFIVQPSGRVEQALGIWDVGPHALRWSSPTIGIAAIGDFNKHAPTPAQWSSAAHLVAELVTAYGLSVDPQTFAGHTERPRATHYAGKKCPGAHWSMKEFRSSVKEMVQELAAQRLAQASRFGV